MSSLAIQTFGTMQVQMDGQPITDFRTRKVQALLVYLAVEPGPHNRNRLLDLLWPGLPERSARSNLRQILYYLRQDISDGFAGNGSDDIPLTIANRQDIQLNPQARVAVDTVRFESLLDTTASHNHVDLLLCQECRQRLEEAVTLYKGDFLNDFFLDDSNIFEEWAQSRREYFRRRAIDTLSILTAVHIRRKEYPQAQKTAERQLEIDDLNENAYRQLMEIHALNGRREQALAVYDNCRRILAEELGMAPAARTTELYQKILAGDLDFDTAQPQGVRGYELKELIAEGGHGAIHRAIQPVIGREVAVKVIRRQYADDPDFIRRFEAEAQIVARLEHPHIVPLYDYWRDPTGAYLVMRYMRHGSLLSALENGPWNPPQTSALLTQVAGALSAAHQKGIVHRDLKPGNILLDESGNAYLTDFGIAKELGRLEPLTADNAVVGTLDYTSPEQILSGEVTAQSDIYSLGAVIYETLTGEKPFADDSIANLLHNHLNTPMPLVTATRPDIPTEIDSVLQKATAKKPAERYATAQEMAAAFFAAAGHPAIEYKPETAADLVPEVAEIYNPYKGLRAFQEADADDFFGRDTLVQQLVDRLGQSSSRFLAIVGPSGSGKSSVVKAGLIPALRGGALPGSENWFTAEMVPGSHPLEELELALWPVAVDPPPSLVEPMERDTRGLLRTIRRILPQEDGLHPQLLLIIDQFEELFTLIEDSDRREFFLDSLLAALAAPHSPLRVVITLRADFYDRPLLHPEWGQLIKGNTEIVLPLNHSELTWAIREPARRMGVRLEDDLIPTIVSDVAGQLGALPLLQYALTELFERRDNNLITHQSYQAIGGVQGALARRAEAIYESLDENGRQATRQLFLRLVTLGEGIEDTRRRVLRTELEKLTIHNSRFIIQNSLLDSFGSARLLTFDRDPTTRTPTVEVAHEALLREWPRLRRWLQQSRDDIRLQRLLAQASAEWLAAGKSNGYLLRGSRLDQFGRWSEETQLALTQDEKQFLAASLAARAARQEAEEARRQRELETARQLAETERRRAEEQTLSVQQLRRRALWLVGAFGVALLLAIVAVFFARQSSLNAEEARASADLAATREIEALTSAELAATREFEAITSAELAATREFEAISNAELAATREAEAEAQRILALSEAEQRTIAQAKAEEAARLAFSRELAAAALASLTEDPERSILLAMHALSVTYTLEAEEALHLAVQTSRMRRALTPPDGMTTNYYLAYHEESDLLFASTCNSGFGTMWELSTGTVVFTHSSITYPGISSVGCVGGAAFSPDGSLLIVPHEEYTEAGEPVTGTVTILEADTGREILSFAAHNSGMQEAVMNWQGTHFATPSGDSEIKIWDLAASLATGTGQLTASLCCHSHNDWMVSAAFSPDDTLLASSGSALDKTVRVWDIATEQELYAYPVWAAEAIFSPDGQYLLIGASNGDILILEAASGELYFTAPHLHSDWVWGIHFSPDGTRLATASGSGHIAVWDYANGELANPLPLLGQNFAQGGIFADDGRYLITADAILGVPGGSVRIWDVSPAGASEFGAYSHDGRAQEVTFSPDGTWLASVGHEGTAKVWDVAGAEVRLTLEGHEGWVVDVAIHPDGRTLATAGDDGTVRIWDAQDGEQLLVFEAHEQDGGGYYKAATSVAFSPDGLRLASGGIDDVARIWDPISGELLLTLAGHAGDVKAIDYSPDGRWLVTAAEDGIVKVWNAADGREQWSLRTNYPESLFYTTASFSADGSRLAAGISGGLVAIWDLPTAGSPPETEPELTLEFFVPGMLEHIDFSLDGEKLVVTGLRESALYDAHTGERLMDLRHTSAGADFSPDGHMLALAGVDGVVRILAIDLDTLLALAQTRVTRWWKEEECQQYLHLETCPTQP